LSTPPVRKPGIFYLRRRSVNS